MPGEEKVAGPEDAEKDTKKPHKSKKGTRSKDPEGKKPASKGSEEEDRKPPKPKKGTRSRGDEAEETASKGSEKEDRKPSKSEGGKQPESAGVEGQKAPGSQDEGPFSEDRFKTYITAYVDSYMNYVEEQNIKDGDFPLLYAYYPLEVAGYILPDDSTCVLFKGLATATNVTVERVEYRKVDSQITEKRYDYISCYPPSFTYTKEEADMQAKRDVDGDIALSKKLGTVQAERAAKDETLKSIRLLLVAMPWVAQREEGEGTLRFPREKNVEEFSSEALVIREDEYFSGYSDRIHRLESALLHGTKISSEPPEEEKKKAVEEKTVQPQAAVAATPVAAAAAAPGTHVTVEIKQPEATGKSEMYKERTDEDILRIKKTLYIQSRDIEEVRRLTEEMSGQLGNLEQMRQTVFRVNRKVFDTDARMAKLEKSNMDILRKFAELRTEQADQNKKMRRFIAERSKKARNQAMALAGVALGVGIISLVFLIFWDDIRPLLGL